jgi:hypothetical protein
MKQSRGEAGVKKRQEKRWIMSREEGGLYKKYEKRRKRSRE